MEFLKKYWWVLLIIALLVIGYFMWMKKKEDEKKTTEKKTPTCTTVTQQVYDQKVNYYIGAIEASQEWLDEVTANIQSGETLADAKRRHAVYMTETVDKYCRPAA